MEFDFDKLISIKNVEKAEIGEKYYFLSQIDGNIVQGNFRNDAISTLKCIDKCSVKLTFETSLDGWYPFIYPYEEEKQYLTYEELKERWIKNPTELYRYNGEQIKIIGMITAFEDGAKTFRIDDFMFDCEVFNGDNWTIQNLTDINGNPLIKE